ncbi:MAG: Ig-like domain-containing protein [Bacteroidaceae bacterium]|nr:Ig-like domain-containing protein [Bacteroidaceae bacterium]
MKRLSDIIKRMSKCFLASVLMIAGSVSVSAQYYMNVFHSDGTVSRYDVSEIDRITFDGQDPDAQFKYVDLGLSVNWATFNVGATSPEEYGDYYAWGEIETKDSYSWENYKWANGSSKTITKYCLDDSNGKVDGKKVLDPEDDVAHVLWGGDWRMPTKDEINELLNHCDYYYTELNGVDGVVFVSMVEGYEDASIFIPLAGAFTDVLHGAGNGAYLFGSSLYASATGAYVLYDVGIGGYSRYMGMPVRPVCPSGSWKGVTSISLDKESVALSTGGSYRLRATILCGEEDYSFLTGIVSWTSDNNNVVSVDDEGVVTALSAGKAVVTVAGNGHSATCEIVVKDYTPVREYVDLGLSVKWATCNVGAMAPTAPGNYYAWGEIEAKSLYTYSNYRFKNPSIRYGYSKYNFDPEDGDIDYKYGLDMEDDVARALWGEGWRMPTVEELTELVESCSWEWISINGTEGYQVTGPNGNQIFLPAANYRIDEGDGAVEGWTSYLSSTLSSSVSGCAMGIDFSSEEYYIEVESRYMGELIRPVYSNSVPENVLAIESISFDKPEITISMGSRTSLNASINVSKGSFDIKPTYYIKDEQDDSPITVTSDGVIYAGSLGTCIVVAELGGFSAECTVNVCEPKYVDEYVDLGLSVKWATCNLGASTPEEFGFYYSWAEIEPKMTYYSNTYKYCVNNSSYELTKYCVNPDYGYEGFVDNKTVLDMEDDAAHVNLQGDWRMPTDNEFHELLDYCSWTYVNRNGVDGYEISSCVAGYEGRSIFLPYAGLMYSNYFYETSGARYWTNTLNGRNNASAYYLYFDQDEYGVYSNSRFYGLPIRPVRP